MRKFTNLAMTPLLFLGTLALAQPAAAQLGSAQLDAAESKAPIEAPLAETLAQESSSDFWVMLTEDADLAEAASVPDWEARGEAVVDELRETAVDSQAGVREILRAEGVDFEPYYIANAILVRDGSEALAAELAARPEVEQLVEPRSATIHEPAIAAADQSIAAVEWGLDAINADDVWSTVGVRGEGIVVANIDTGVQFDHPGLARQYRGYEGGAIDHNYNWFDPTGVCGTPSQAPCDNNGHGTITMGVMVGDDGDGNQVGVAPGARWIAAKGCASSNCSTAEILAAGQWILAPTDLDGANPRPDLRPNIVNNSWGFGDDPFFQAIVDAWRAAGIFPAMSIGNAGPACNTGAFPGDHDGSYATGAFDIDGNIAAFSSRGPGQNGNVKPDLAAPGVDVRSTAPPDGYGSFSGTSVASPHTAGAVALMWSAVSGLVGNIDRTVELLDSAAVDVDDTTCGGASADNNGWGEGKLDAFAAVMSSRGPVGTLTGTVSDVVTGNRVADAHVRVADPVSRDLRTGSDGGYRTTWPVGDVTITVTAFGYVTSTSTTTITEGQITTLDIALTLLPRSTVRGQVVDSLGLPVEGMRVELVGVPLDPALTGGDGRYAIPNVPHGDYDVRVSANGCAEGQTRSVAVDGDVTEDFSVVADADAFGYRCGMGSTAYVEGDTPLALSGDDSSATVALPFGFTLYGQTYQQAQVSTNGFVTFLSPSTEWVNPSIPDPAAPNAAIYPFFDDLGLDGDSEAFTMLTGTVPNREFLIEWRNARFITDPQLRFDVEVVLSEGGRIEFRYRNLDHPREWGNSATVGIENDTGTDALQFSFNAPALADSQSIHFVPPHLQLKSTTTTLSSDTNPSVAGQAVIYTAALAPVPSGGTVSFTDDGAAIDGCAGVPVDTTAGTATCQVGYPVAGSHPVTAAYSGDGLFTASTSEVWTQTVEKVAATVTLSTTGSTYGKPVVLTATVTSPAPGSGVASGTVRFTDGSLSLGAATLGGDGRASLTVLLPPGAAELVAHYVGDAAFAAADSVTTAVEVGCTTTISATRNSGLVVASGSSVCLIGATVKGAVTVLPGGAFAALDGARVAGLLTAARPTGIAVCGSRIEKGATITGASGPVMIGDSGNACTGSTLGGLVTLSGNAGGLTLDGATVASLTTLASNRVTGLPTGQLGTIQVAANRFHGSLVCTANTPPPTNDGRPNTVAGRAFGQCLGL